VISMELTRRAWLGVAAGSLSTGAVRGSADRDQPGHTLGVVIHSYGIRLAADRGKMPGARIDEPLVFLEHVHRLGAGGIQVGIGTRTDAECVRFREAAESKGMYLEGTIRLPRNSGDVARFESEVTCARLAGARILRSVMSDGRRYEVFRDAASFRKSGDEAFQRLSLAAPVVVRHDMQLAIENHKDWRVNELIGILKRLGNDHVGVCLDTGNSIALLEDPMEVVEGLAPWAITTHIKDMDVEDQRDGFGLSEVPLGRGYLDLPRMIRVLREARPTIRFNIEMITRNPLSIPCLTETYWATMEAVPGNHLARTLRTVRERPRNEPLPRVTKLTRDDQIALEDENVRLCIEYGRKTLGL
jgi:3-oxoisoapionate decarboxylase